MHKECDRTDGLLLRGYALGSIMNQLRNKTTVSLGCFQQNLDTARASILERKQNQL
jgi:hypothetical protein